MLGDGLNTNRFGQKNTISGFEKTLEKITTYANVKQIVVTKDALFDMENLDYVAIINDADEQGIFVVNKDFVEKYKQTSLEIKPEKKEEEQKISFPAEIIKSIKIPAADLDSDFVIMHDSYISEKEERNCNISDFDAYFKTRYKELKKILMKHTNVNAVSSKALKFTKEGEKVGLIGMVIEKRNTKKGNVLIRLDDLEGEFKIVILQNTPLGMFEKRIVIDDVLAVKGKYLGNGMIVAEEIEYPSLPSKPYKKATRELNLLCTSDIHLGSKLFHNEMFEKFINWLNMRNVDAKEREEIGKIKYIVIAGDIVDGIGVYPQQLGELNIIDIREQYETLANYISQIPEYVDIFIIPGNHDAVRRADPQPPIPKQFANKFYDLKNVHMIGSPSNVIIEGLNVLMYHGNSMNTLQFQLKIDTTKPEIAMSEYLFRRDLSSVYGEKQPNIPDAKATMIIKNEPDIFITGHIHSNGYSMNSGTILVNPGCWQAQTVFQKEQGHTPTPGRVPIIQLNKSIYFEKVFKNDES